MRPQAFHYKHLTLTYGNFQVIRNRIPESSQILSQTLLTFHSTLVVNCPSQASFEKTECSSLSYHFYVHIGLFQLALRAI